MVHQGKGGSLVLPLAEQLRRRANATKSPAAQPQHRDPHPGPPKRAVLHSLVEMVSVAAIAIIGRTRMSVQQRARLRHQAEISGLPLEGGILQWLVDKDLGAQHVMAYRLKLEPDSALSHVHPGAEEVLYVLEGGGEIRIEGTAHAVSRGQAVFIPEG